MNLWVERYMLELTDGENIRYIGQTYSEKNAGMERKNFDCVKARFVGRVYMQEKVLDLSVS